MDQFFKHIKLGEWGVIKFCLGIKDKNSLK